MKKAMRQAAGAAVLGVALAAAAVTPAAAADGLGGALGDAPTGALTGGPAASGGQLLDPQSGSVHAVTGTAQSLVDTAAPSVQALTQGASGAAAAPAAPRAMPSGLTSGLPMVGQLPAVGGLSDLSSQTAQTTGSLNHLTTGLPVHTTFGQPQPAQ